MLFMNEILEKLPKNAALLDLGCGQGSFDYQKYPDLNIFAIDLTQPAKPFPKNASFVAGDSTSLPFDAGSFDAVIANWTLEHFVNLDSSFSEVWRVLKNGGLFYCSIPDSTGLDDRIYRRLYIGSHVQKFQFESFVKKLYAHSFEMVSFCDWASGFNFLHDHKYLHFLQRAVIKASKVSDRVFKTKLSRCGWIFMFRKAEKPGFRKGLFNVCRKCGCGTESAALVGKNKWPCRSCGTENDVFETPNSGEWA